eukprot:1514670-Amphidinium_carterae.1
MEQRDTGARRISTTVSELERRDLQLRVNSKIRNCTIDEDGTTYATHTGDIRSHPLLTEDLASITPWPSALEKIPL